MSLTLGLTGMDPATEAALKAAFIEANARLGGRWALVPDAEASHVVVDMDSMYGPMSWLRLHAAGRQVIGLTSAPRTQTDYRLGRPFDVAQLMALLADVARGAGIELQAGGAAAPADSAPAPTPTPEAQSVAPAPVAAAQPATTPAPATAAAEVAAAEAATADALPAPAPAPAPTPAAAPTPIPAPAEATTPAAAPAVPTPPSAPPAASERSLAAWLQPGAITGRVRYRAGDGTSLLIDADADAWHGPAALKATAACFQGTVAKADLETLDAAAWAREAAAAGPAQPLSRLRWLGGLLAGGGNLLPGQDPEGRFQLNKWPQTEREYPRHFRIATQMMRGPATVAEIAGASGVPAADVADFINANLATGFAEPAVDAPAAAEEPAKARGGLLGRLRSR